MNYYFTKSILLIIAATASTAVSADTSGVAKAIDSFSDALDDCAHDPVSASINDDENSSYDTMKMATTTR